MQPQIRLNSNDVQWSGLLRVRTLMVVLKSGNYYQNCTGRNSDPVLGDSNWKYIGTNRITSIGNFVIHSRPFGNNRNEIMAGDICSGLLSDGLTMIPFGKYLGNLEGNNTDNEDNWDSNPIYYNPL